MQVTAKQEVTLFNNLPAAWFKKGAPLVITGTVTKAASDFATEAGVTAAEGAGQLIRQGYYVSVPSSSVKLSS